MYPDTTILNSIGIFPFFLSLVFFFFYAYCQYVLSKKFGVTYSWMAFVPILNLVNLIKISGGNWKEIFILFVPFVNIYWIVRYFWFWIAQRTDRDLMWMLWLIILPFIFFPIVALSYKKPVDGTWILQNGNEDTFSRDLRFFIYMGYMWFVIAVVLSLIFIQTSKWLSLRTLDLYQSNSPVHNSWNQDAKRIDDITYLGILVTSYYMIESKYPETPASECISDIEALKESIANRVLPNNSEDRNIWKCASGYAYKTFQKQNGEMGFVIATRIQDRTIANFNGSLWNNLTHSDLKWARVRSVQSTHLYWE